MSDREVGWYWTQFINPVWIPSFWNGACWLVPGLTKSRPADCDLRSIGTRIEPPAQKDPRA